VITKDGVTVAESVVLIDPVENIGATLIKEAARNTVKEAGDGTTTATVLAQSLLQNVYAEKNIDVRQIKNGISSGLQKVNKYLSKHSKAVSGNMLKNVASISCNNDKELGYTIASAFEQVGKNGVVLMEESETDQTYVDIVDGVQIDSGIKSQHLITDKQKNKIELEDAYVLIVSSPIPNIRKIQSVLEFVIKNKKSLLLIAEVDQQPFSALLMNKVKGNIKINIIDPPGFGPSRLETLEDLAMLTGAKLINEELGDDLDMISPDVLGFTKKAVTDNKTTVITIEERSEDVVERIKTVENKIKEEKHAYLKKKLEQRLAMLSGAVGVVRVGANSKIELKEKKDRVEDAIYATKAALKEGIVPGGGVALLNASQNIEPKNEGEQILLESIKWPYSTILDNAGIPYIEPEKEGFGIDVTTGDMYSMMKAGIIDPVLVTKTALINAVSVVNTIISADCVISNVREV
jgi:chaperonin GroEL